MKDIHDDRQTVYEIGYNLVPSIPEEQVSVEADKLRKIITDFGASIVSEEMPHRQPLAYTMRRKTVSGSYEKYDEAYFGWVKFEIGASAIEAVKKAIEVLPSLLRMLLVTTVRENTYLGKRVLDIVKTGSIIEDKLTAHALPVEVIETAVTPATIEEMDKSIDEMVKEVQISS